MRSPRLGDLIAAERIRLLSLRSTHYFLACSVVIAVAGACLLSAKLNIRPVDRASFPSLDDAFNADTGGLLMTIAACFGASIMTGEYSSGLIRVTFTASPARGRVMLAKTLALAAVAGIASAVATAAVVLASQVILSSGHYAGPFSQTGRLRAAAAFALLMPLGAITGLAVGAVLRRPVIAVLAVVAVLTLLPSLITPTGRGMTVYGAWSILASQQDPGTPASAAISWLVHCGWPAIWLTLATILVQRHDV
jgi:ABC-type transport system involved in multi-copper enzyme maturation permease subunit